MTRLLVVWTMLNLVGLVHAVPVELSGNTGYYYWDRPGEQELDQRIYFSAQPTKDLSLKLSGRANLLMDRGDQKWQVDEAALQWVVSPSFQLKLGRSYPSIGASIGLVDGAEVRLQNRTGLAATLFGGASGKYYRRPSESYGDHWNVGAGLSYRTFPRLRADAYVIHESYRGRTFRQQLGWSFFSNPGSHVSLSTFGRIDLKNQELAYSTASIGYELRQDLRVSADYYQSEPRLPEETRDIRLPRYQEAGLGIDWRLWDVLRLRTSIGSIHTADESGDSERVSLSWKQGEISLSVSLHRYQLGDLNRMIWSGRLHRMLVARLGLAAKYRRLQYEYRPDARAYLAHTLGGELDWSLLKTWYISVATEYSWRDGGLNSDTRVYGNVGYRFRQGEIR